jgi:hypothetical protein
MEYEFEGVDILTFEAENEGYQFGNIPTTVELTMSYYQVNEELKKIIKVGLVYGKYITLNEDQLSGKEKIPYELMIKYDALSHTNLMILFAFQWYFYIVLYLIIGLLSVMVIFVFMIYHRIMARGEKIPKFKFFSYIKLKIPQAVYGITIALIPVMLIKLIIALFVTGELFTFTLYIWGPCGEVQRNSCEITLFDRIIDSELNVNVDYTVLRTGRCGVSFIVVGIMIMNIAVSVLIPNKQDDSKVYESYYDGNIWPYFSWKRTNFIFVTLFWVQYGLCLIYFSQSDFFGDNSYYCIFLMRVVAIIWNFIF